MNISVNGLFTNCYNYISSRLSTLSPLQKKVAIFAVAYFSCATAGYFIYRLYCFYANPNPISAPEKDDEISPMLRTDQLGARSIYTKKQVKTPSFSSKSEECTEKDSDNFYEDRLPVPKLKHSSSKENQSVVRDETDQKKKLDGSSEKAKKMEKLEKEKTWATLKDMPSDLFGNVDIEDLSGEVLPNEEKVDSLSPFTASSILTFKPIPRDIRQSEIAKRLKKNCDYAADQQKLESAKGFVTDRNCPTDFIGKPIDVIGQTDDSKFDRPVGIASCIGLRRTMEDTHIATTISLTLNQKIHEASVFGVFDGHGGDQASLFVQENIAHYLKGALESHNLTDLTDLGIWNALKACFKKLDKDYPNEQDGTTATVALILNDKIWVANVGDSRTILVKKDGVATQASEDAKPSMDRYRKHIEKLGGSVIWGRVLGNLAVARAIGDKYLQVQNKDNISQCCVSPNPKITCYPLKDYIGGHLVLACDGLYDVATTNEVGQSIKNLADLNAPTQEMAQNLVYAAMDHGSQDNVSVVVVGL